MDILAVARAFIAQYVDLTDDEIAAMSVYFEMREFRRKEVIVAEGEIENYFNYILKGLVRRYFHRGSEEMVVYFAREGHVMSCYESFYTRLPSKYAMEAIEPTMLVSITHDNLEKIFQISPKIERIARVLVTNQYLEREDFNYDRIRLTSQQRFLKFVKDNRELLQRVPQKYLASYLNMKPETFSRLKHLLKRGSS